LIRRESLTERDARVLLADLFPIVIGEEHVCRETTLGRVGVWDELARMAVMREDRNQRRIHTLLLSLDSGLGLAGGGLLLRHFG